MAAVDWVVGRVRTGFVRDGGDARNGGFGEVGQNGYCGTQMKRSMLEKRIRWGNASDDTRRA